jgi:pimeloyl-ACP methyl ester carboxylesterase
VQENAPHRIDFQLFSPAMAPSAYIDRTVHRDGRSVALRDFGGDGPLLLLWHGARCDASIWEAMVPHLRSFRVVAQDLPGHGGSSLPRLAVGDTLADTRALLGDLRSDRPIVVGHSMGGWAALHFAATHPCRALVSLDGPTTLDYAAMGITADHPGYVPDPPDVPADLGSLRCPTMVMLCRGESTIEEEWMVPFRAGLSDHLATKHPAIRVVWQDTGHMVVLSQPKQTADLIGQFIGDLA